MCTTKRIILLEHAENFNYSKCCLCFVSHSILPPWDWNCIKCEGKLFIWLFYERNRGPFNTVKGWFSTIIKIKSLILNLSFQKIISATLMVWSSILKIYHTKTCRLQKKHQQTDHDSVLRFMTPYFSSTIFFHFADFSAKSLPRNMMKL